MILVTFAPIEAAVVAEISVPVWLMIISGIITIAAAVTGAVAVARQVAIRQSLATITDANVELRQVIADVKAEQLAEREAARRDLADERERRAKLEGKLDAVTTGLAEQIVQAVAAALQRQPTTVTNINTGQGGQQ